MISGVPFCQSLRFGPPCLPTARLDFISLSFYPPDLFIYISLYPSLYKRYMTSIFSVCISFFFIFVPRINEMRIANVQMDTMNSDAFDEFNNLLH